MQYGTDPPSSQQKYSKKTRTNPSPKSFQKHENKNLISNIIKTIVQKKVNLNIDLDTKIQLLSYSIV